MNGPWRCFTPLVGLASGFALGWVVHFLLPQRSESIDIAARLLALIYGIFGWALGIVLARRKLHCGGTQDLDKDASKRYGPWALIELTLLIIVVVLLVRGFLWFYFPLVFLMLCILIGEIGWGNPGKPFGLGPPSKPSDPPGKPSGIRA